MNSNREERLQMRQRGAATRKPKEVDFGFSFGGLGSAIGGPSASEPTAQQPAGIVGIGPEPPAPAIHTQPPSSPKIRQLGTPEQAAIQRTPGSARNARPARPSMFDIPPDEDEEPTPGSRRSNKRRKIETPTKVSMKQSTGVDSRRDETRPAEPHQDGTTTAPEKPVEVPDFPPTVGKTEVQPPTEVPVPAPAISDVKETQQDEKPKLNGKGSQPQVVEAPSQEVPQEEPVQEAQPVQPAEAPQETPPEALSTETSQEVQEAQPVEVAPAKKSPTETTQEIRQPQEAQETPAAEAAPAETSPPQEVQEPKRTTPPRQTKAKPKKREPQETQDTQAVEAAAAPKTSPTQAPQELQEPGRTAPSRQAKRKKPQVAQETQPAEQAEAPEAVQEAPPETSPAQTQEAPEERQEQKRAKPPRQTKGKRKRRGSQEDQPSSENIAAPETTETTQAPEKPESQEPTEESISKPREKRQRGRPPASAQAPSDKGKEPEKAVSDGAPVPDQSRRGRRGRSGKDRNPFKETTHPTRPLQAEAEVEPPRKDYTTETPQQPSPETEATRKRAGRPKKAARAEPQEEAPRDEPEPTQPSAPRGGPDDTAAAQPAEQESQNQREPTRTRRKPRPRGETVPVTVHRLVNIPSLGGLPDPSDTSSEDSADELSTRQKTKLPNRGGVNQADVLNQICRETLEKTVTTLKNGIANESNATRKAEWTLKKKAVETYGTELEGRLFEMSEMLDSNFVLGVKFKRAKREMMEMRSRLYHVRREREGIAVQMDTVRRKHAEGESSRVARADINNTLHSLELAVHRSQHRPEEEPPDPAPTTTSGLEYLVRTVAEDVSSRGHGQGGLLNQIKSFNAELEAAARTLES